jgi:hypothetical protein
MSQLSRITPSGHCSPGCICTRGINYCGDYVALTVDTVPDTIPDPVPDNGGAVGGTAGPIVSPANVKDDDFIKVIKKVKMDIMFRAAMGENILDGKWLEILRHLSELEKDGDPSWGRGIWVKQVIYFLNGGSVYGTGYISVT